MFILKFANGVKSGHAPTNRNDFLYIPTLCVLHTYTPLPLPATPSGRVFFYSIQVPYLLFDFSCAKIFLFSPLLLLPFLTRFPFTPTPSAPFSPTLTLTLCPYLSPSPASPVRAAASSALALARHEPLPQI